MKDKINMKITPTTIGTDVLFTISRGSFFVLPATIITTADTGETARNKFPASPIGTVTAYGLILAAAAKGTISGTIAKNNAVPLPLNNTMIAVNKTKINGNNTPDALVLSIVF